MGMNRARSVTADTRHSLRRAWSALCYALFLHTMRPAGLAVTWLLLLWWERALSELQTRDASHPDVPYAVLRVHALRQELERDKTGH
jgi:hypothetical protein